MLDPETAIELGETLGEVVTDEAEKEMVGGDFVRVRVRIDVSKPLSRGRRVVLDEGSETWVSFKYEKLSNFCYWCGLVTHDEKECEKWLAGKGSNHQVQQEYGAWLRATPFNPGRTSYTTVSGMGDGLGGVTEKTAGQKNGVAMETPLVASQGEPSPAGVSNCHSNVDSPRASHMETADIVEDSVRNSSSSLSPIIQIFNSPNPAPAHNRQYDFEKQIEEIDSALNMFDSHSISTTVKPNITPSHSQPSANNF